MLRSSVVVALRGVLRHKGYTLLNVLGLAVGMAVCLLVAAFVRYETGYDAQHSRRDRIYRVLRETRDADGISRFADGTSGPLAAVMQAEIPEVERATRMWDHWIGVKSGDSHLYRMVAVVDPAFFEIFDFEMLSGSTQALASPGTILVTEGNARLIFGDENAIGKPIHLQGDQGAGDYTVAGVIREPAHNTTVWFDLVTTHHPEGFHRPQWEDWLPGAWRMTTNYVLLREGADPGRAEAKLRPMLARFLGPELAKTDSYHLQALARTHLYGGADFGMRMGGSIGQVLTYALTAGLVLLIACINFANLSTARSSRRAREIGVRKVSGARRSQLVVQFLGESVLLSLLSLAVAAILVSLGQAWFDELIGIRLEPAWDLLAVAVPAGGVVGVLAGLYPALLLTHVEPAAVLERNEAPSRGARLRRGLVVCQFAASVLFATLAMTVRGQLAFIENRPLGYDQDHVVILWMINRKAELYEQLDHVKQRLRGHPNVISVAGLFGWGLVQPVEVTVHEIGREGEHAFHQIGTDPDFQSTFRVKLTRGRDFEPRTTEAVVNETAVRAMGWDDPIGRQIDWPGEVGPLTVVGVVEDFHFQSLRSPVSPVVLYHMWFASQLNVRIAATDLPATLDHLQAVWQELAPEYPFEYEFLDQEIGQSYAGDRRAARLATTAAALSGFVSCLGLLGLASFATERRRKEISIRRILGASVARVVAILSGEFLVLVTAANLVAAPIGYLLARQWLDGFAYRMDLGVEAFGATAGIALLLALATVATHTLRAAVANPVDALREG